MPGPSSLRFPKGELVSKVFPGLLTVSLLAAEGLPVVLVSLPCNRLDPPPDGLSLFLVVFVGVSV